MCTPCRLVYWGEELFDFFVAEAFASEPRQPRQPFQKFQVTFRANTSDARPEQTRKSVGYWEGRWGGFLGRIDLSLGLAEFVFGSFYSTEGEEVYSSSGKLCRLDAAAFSRYDQLDEAGPF